LFHLPPEHSDEIVLARFCCSPLGCHCFGSNSGASADHNDDRSGEHDVDGSDVNYCGANHVIGRFNLINDQCTRRNEHNDDVDAGRFNDYGAWVDNNDRFDVDINIDDHIDLDDHHHSPGNG
jgi:hypothetical protein